MAGLSAVTLQGMKVYDMILVFGVSLVTVLPCHGIPFLGVGNDVGDDEMHGLSTNRPGSPLIRDMPVPPLGAFSPDIDTMTPVVRSQLAVAELPEFKGNVTTVNTTPFYPTELDVFFYMRKMVGKQIEQAKKEGKPGPGPETVRNYDEWSQYKGNSNKSYHYMGSAECFVGMGDAFAEAMIDLMRTTGTPPSP